MVSGRSWHSWKDIRLITERSNPLVQEVLEEEIKSQMLLAHSRLWCALSTSSATCGWSAWPLPLQWCTPIAPLQAAPPTADSSGCQPTGKRACCWGNTTAIAALIYLGFRLLEISKFREVITQSYQWSSLMPPWLTGWLGLVMSPHCLSSLICEMGIVMIPALLNDEICWFSEVIITVNFGKTKDPGYALIISCLRFWNFPCRRITALSIHIQLQLVVVNMLGCRLCVPIPPFPSQFISSVPLDLPH